MQKHSPQTLFVQYMLSDELDQLNTKKRYRTSKTAIAQYRLGINIHIILWYRYVRTPHQP